MRTSHLNDDVHQQTIIYSKTGAFIEKLLEVIDPFCCADFLTPNPSVNLWAEICKDSAQMRMSAPGQQGINSSEDCSP